MSIDHDAAALRRVSKGEVDVDPDVVAHAAARLKAHAAQREGHDNYQSRYAGVLERIAATHTEAITAREAKVRELNLVWANVLLGDADETDEAQVVAELAAIDAVIARCVGGLLIIRKYMERDRLALGPLNRASADADDALERARETARARIAAGRNW